jgi:hypothetical protein
MTIKGIKIEFKGNIDTVEDRKEPYLVSRMPVGSRFKGSFQFYDTGDLWPEPGDYTTPDLSCLFKIECANGFIKTVDFAIQTKIVLEEGRSKLWVYGHTDVTKDGQWTFGIGFYYTVDTSGSIEWDFNNQQSVSLDVSVGGHSEGGPPERINSVMHGQAHTIEQPVVVKTKSDSNAPSSPINVRVV